MQRTIHYRAVEWFGQQEMLVDLIKSTLNQRPNVNDTAFSVGNQICEVRHRDESAHEVRLHFSLHVPGAQKSVRPDAVGATEADLTSSPPPAGSEYTEREIAVVVRDNMVGYVAAGRTHGSTVAKAIAGLIRIQHGEGISNRLMLSARANPEAIQHMLALGVDRFDLGLSLPHADASEIIDGQPLSISATIGRAVVNGLSARFHADHDDASIDELANMDVSLTINARRGAPTAEIEALTSLASAAVEEDEQFTIRTLNKATFTRDQLLLTSSFSQPGDVPVLSYVLAWNNISVFLDSVQ